MQKKKIATWIRKFLEPSSVGWVSGEVMNHSLKVFFATTVIFVIIVAFLTLFGLVAIVYAGPKDEIQEYEECTPEEVAYYESQGWDSWECHWDKTQANPNYEWLGDVMDDQPNER